MGNFDKNSEKKAINRFILLICSVVIGIGISMQINIAEKYTGSKTTSQRARTLQTELKNLKEKREAMEKEIAELEHEMEELRGDGNFQKDVERQLQEQIDKYEKRIGYKKVSGKGIEVELFENLEADSSVLVNNYELLLALINKLNAAGAEAIAVNEERYVLTTQMQMEGGVLKMNGNTLKPPIVVRAIGDADTLEAAMNFRYGILWEMRNYYGIDAKVTKRNELDIPRYNQVIEYHYAKIVEE